MRKLVYISGTVSLMLTLLGILFKIMHLMGANILFFIGMALMALIFVPAFAKYLYDKKY